MGPSTASTQRRSACKFIYAIKTLVSRGYLRTNRITHTHLEQLRRAFLDCDESGLANGIISKRAFLIQIAQENLKFPLEFMIHLLHDI